MTRVAVGWLGAVALLALSACEGAPPAVALNILLVTLDTTRADHLGSYGYFRDTSPALDALARESIVFERAIVPMATTLPTHVSVLTATYPQEHGVLANHFQGGRRFVPTPALHSIAEVSRDAGYRTAAFVSAAPLKRGSGIDAGFETFDEPTERDRNAGATVDAALAWLEEIEERPFFLFVHFYDAHYPYRPPAPHMARYGTDDALEHYIERRQISPRAPRPLVGERTVTRPAINAYDGELRYQDEQFGRLIEGLKRSGDWDSTAVVALTDHGEGLGQHGAAAHGDTWDEQVRAALLIRVPGEAPRRVAETVSVIDAFPTLLGLADLGALSGFGALASGRDVFASDFRERPVLSQDTGRKRAEPYKHALTFGRWKYFRIQLPDGTTREALYDLVEDPFELEEVSGRHSEQTAKLREALRVELASLRARGEALHQGDVPRTVPEDPRILEQLRALGYVVEGEESNPEPEGSDAVETQR